MHPWESTNRGPLKHNTDLPSQRYVAISVCLNTVLRSRLAHTISLALTEQVAHEQAHCKINACVFFHMRSRTVKSSKMGFLFFPSRHPTCL